MFYAYERLEGELGGVLGNVGIRRSHVKYYDLRLSGSAFGDLQYVNDLHTHLMQVRNPSAELAPHHYRASRARYDKLDISEMTL